MASLFSMNGAKIWQQEIWGSRNYQITSYFGDSRNSFPRPWLVHFNSSDMHCLVSLILIP